MKVSLKWLSDYVEVPSDTKAYCDLLDLTGTGVEGVDKLGATFDHVVVGYVETCEEHPDSDHMHVVTVRVNPDEAPIQIVCGAPNIAAGIKLPVALVGAELPGGVKIKKGKLRGVVSNGMCCSARELGQGSDHSGIWILPEDAPVGMPIAEYLGMSDTVLDLEITPNRPDCLSIVGFARETGAMYRRPFTNPVNEMAGKLALDASTDINDLVTVTIQDPQRCGRYSARLIQGVKVGPSPEWLVERLAAIGQRSINNIVDVTNYILFLFGQPLHAFDFDKLQDASGKANVVVRAAKDGEQFTTLDGVERRLTSDMTVIATPQCAVALAGVMGGLDSEVTEDTTNVLLETATFDNGHTSRTSRNLGLISESSMRYERLVDDNGIDLRSAAAAALMVEVAGGTVAGSADGTGLVDVWPVKTEPRKLALRVARCQKMLGAEISVQEMCEILTLLGCTVTESQVEGVLDVVAPTFRPDLEREIDLYEEILRLYGMDRIAPTLPEGRGRLGVITEAQQIDRKLHATLSACGLNETMTYSFASADDVDKLRMNEADLGEAVELINPMNADQAFMRRTIIPGLLRSVAYNQSRGVDNIQLYEIGTVFAAKEGAKQPKERRKIAGVMAGAMGPAAWNCKPAPFDFFDGKGVLEAVARTLALPKVRFRALDAQVAGHLQPGRAAEMLSGGTVIGWVGEIHPLAAAAFEAQAPVVAFELDIAALTKASRPARDYVDVPQFPGVTRDVALVVDEAVTSEKLTQVMTSAGGKLLEGVSLFDVYRDEQRVGAGKKSMAYSLSYRAADRTLTSEEVDKIHAKVIAKVSAATGAEVR